MAIPKTATTVTSLNNNPATAFLNIVVIGKEGEKHALRTGVALYASNKLDAAIIKKFAEDKDAHMAIEVSSVRSNTTADVEYDI
jgi:hypothetical protein